MALPDRLGAGAVRGLVGEIEPCDVERKSVADGPDLPVLDAGERRALRQALLGSARWIGHDQVRPVVHDGAAEVVDQVE